MVLLAAGRSTRFGTLKQVAPIGPSGASILAYTVADALIAGFGEVVMVIRDEVEPVIRAHISAHLGDRLPIRFVDQSEPLGTGHAVLMALRTMNQAAGVANGDDFYGRDALTALRASVQEMSVEKLSVQEMPVQKMSAPAMEGAADAPVARASLIGYRMADTLSPHGGVSRGHVEVDEEGRVMSITELHGVRWSEDASAGLTGHQGDEREVRVPSSAWASMNLWGLGRGCGALLERKFQAWLQQPAEGRGEFAISTVLNDLRGETSVEIGLAGSGEEWFGLTFSPDADEARRRLEAKHADGTYPVSLKEMVDPHRG